MSVLRKFWDWKDTEMKGDFFLVFKSTRIKLVSIPIFLEKSGPKIVRLLFFHGEFSWLRDLQRFRHAIPQNFRAVLYGSFPLEILAMYDL